MVCLFQRWLGRMRALFQAIVALVAYQERQSRSREYPYGYPPAQIPAGAANALDSQSRILRPVCDCY
jgi:hypothetical protein